MEKMFGVGPKILCCYVIYEKTKKINNLVNAISPHIVFCMFLLKSLRLLVCSRTVMNIIVRKISIRPNFYL